MTTTFTEKRGLLNLPVNDQLLQAFARALIVARQYEISTPKEPLKKATFIELKNMAHVLESAILKASRKKDIGGLKVMLTALIKLEKDAVVYSVRETLKLLLVVETEAVISLLPPKSKRPVFG